MTSIDTEYDRAKVPLYNGGNGKSLDSPENGNVDKMSEKSRKKKSEKLSRGAVNTKFRTFFGQFLPIWSMLLFGDPVQCMPATTLYNGDDPRPPLVV